MQFNKLIDENNYNYNAKSKKGVYIIHGFTNSTYETKDLAKYLGIQGFNAVANNLPGHGTSVEDCNRCKFNDWIDFVENEVAEMSAKCDKIFIVGISMGSVLALHLCSVFPINAAVFGSTVLKFNDYIGSRILTPIFHKIIRTRKKELSYPKEIRDKLNFLGYPVWPLSAVNEFRKLTNKVKKELVLVKNPALLLQSSEDKLQHPSNTKYVYNSITSRDKEKIIFNNVGHNLFVLSSEQKNIFKIISDFLKKY